MNTSREPSKSLVLIDDDPVFCNILAGTAASLGIQLDYYNSILEMGYIFQLVKYRVAIVDYDLGPINGIEVAEYIPTLLGDMPLLLVSAYELSEIPHHPWPTGIVSFLNKKAGAESILAAAYEMLARQGSPAPKNAYT